MQNTIGQILTLISYIVFWSSRFRKNKKNILFVDCISRMITITAFLFLHSFNGIQNTLFATVRNIVGVKTADKKPSVKRTAFLVLLIILFLMYGIFFNGISTVCVGICGILNLYGTIMCDEQGLRLCCISGSGFYATFLLITGNITGFVCETIGFFIMLYSYFLGKKKAPEI